MNPLSTVDSLHSGSRSNPSRGSHSHSGNGGNNSIAGGMPGGGGSSSHVPPLPGRSAPPKGLKRSPYLSTMTATKQSFDPVEALSRPTAAKPAGGSETRPEAEAGPTFDFFDLKRPSSTGGNRPSVAAIANANVNVNVNAALPSIRSALRVGTGAGTGTNNHHHHHPHDGANRRDSNGDGMKSARSVTFSNTTKKASRLGMNLTTAALDGPKEGNEEFRLHHGDHGGGDHGAGSDRVPPPSTSPSADAAPLGSLRYSAAAMMKKSQSVASPQMMMTTTTTMANAGGSNTGSDEDDTTGNSNANVNANANFNVNGGNAQFPIYLAKFECASPSPSPLEQARLKSKSTSTLRDAPSSQGKMAGMGQPQRPNAFLDSLGMKSIPSTANVDGRNLTFRDMLDEGDGDEGDLNLRLRNQQWKDFRTFSRDWNEKNGDAADVVVGGGNAVLLKMKSMQQQQQQQQQQHPHEQRRQRAHADEHLRSSLHQGIKRGSDGLLPPALVEEGDDERSCATERDEGDALDVDNAPTHRTAKRPSVEPDPDASSSERQSRLPPQLPPQPQPQMHVPIRQNLLGSHRAAVSVNDLAMLRRAAARMNNPNAAAAAATPWGGGTTPSMQRPGQTLGGAMLSRIPSEASSSTMGGANGVQGAGGSDHDSGGDHATIPSSSPLAQMLKNKSGTHPTAAPTASLLQMKLAMAMANNNNHNHNRNRNSSNASTSLMGRRSRTIGAGLAYGGANCHTVETAGVNGARLSRFDLGAMGNGVGVNINVAAGGCGGMGMGMGLSSGGGGGGGGGQNESWD